MEKSEAYYRKMKYTPVLKLIVMLGIPTTISMLITNIYNAVDTYFVGTLGESPQAATGILFTLQCIIQAFAFMLGHGSGTYVAKKLADKDIHGASVYVSTAFFNGLIVGTILLIFGTVFINPFMILLGSSDTVLPYAREYGFWVLISAPFLITSLILNNNLRYEGKAFFSMIGLVSGALLNIFGDFIFINVMDLGVFGAGMSTGISQLISFIILLILYIKYAQGKISIKLFSMDIMVHFNIFRGGLPSLIRQGLTSVSNGILNNLVKPFGDAAVAAISVVNRYSNLIMCTGLGIGQGFQPVAAFNYGVKDYSRVKKGIFVTLIISTIVVGLLSIVGLIIPDKIVWLFQKNQEVINLGAPALRYASIGIIFLPISVTANMLFQSIRKNLIASFLSTLRSGAIFIPALLIFSFTDLGFTGITLAQPISDIIAAAISIPFLVFFIIKTPNTSISDKNNDLLSENNEKITKNQ